MVFRQKPAQDPSKGGWMSGRKARQMANHTTLDTQNNTVVNAQREVLKRMKGKLKEPNVNGV